MTQHISVLLRESVEVLSPEQGGLFLDCTFGGGGHTRAILEASEESRVVALDCDADAVVRAEQVAADYPGRFTFYSKNFSEIETLTETGFNGVLFDLGVSSFQLDEGERGFSFRYEAPIDMRMDRSATQSASEFLETASREALVTAIRDYGEEQRWRKVIDAILAARGSGRLDTTLGVASLIEEVLGRNPRKRNIHPATQVFQGIRIAVNRELEVIETGLPAAFAKLSQKGVLAVISFHSLEDRIVKRFFKRMAGRPEHRLDSRTQDEREVSAQLITRKPIIPSEEEIAANPRSRSSKLRALSRI